MKFFKHFVDGHSSYAMTELMNQFGLEGYGAYFVLLELCASKMEKARDEDWSEEHMTFRIHARVLREKFRMKSTKVQLMLNLCSTLELLRFKQIDNEFIFEIPKLLECLDRDSRRARKVRAECAPKNKNKEEEEEEERPRTDHRRPEPEETGPRPAKPKLVRVPPNYDAFADRFDPDKAELCRNATEVLTEVLGARASPGLRALVPKMLRSVGWDGAEFAAIAARLKVEFDSKPEPPGLAYREITLKNVFGLIEAAP